MAAVYDPNGYYDIQRQMMYRSEAEYRQAMMEQQMKAQYQQHRITSWNDAAAGAAPSAQKPAEAPINLLLLLED